MGLARGPNLRKRFQSKLFFLLLHIESSVKASEGCSKKSLLIDLRICSKSIWFPATEGQSLTAIVKKAWWLQHFQSKSYRTEGLRSPTLLAVVLSSTHLKDLSPCSWCHRKAEFHDLQCPSPRHYSIVPFGTFGWMHLKHGNFSYKINRKHIL